MSAIIDDLILPSNTKKIRNFELDATPQMLYNKLIKGLALNKQILELFDDDIKDFDESWDDLPNTMSAIIDVVTIDGEERIIMKGAGGSSAANLLGRFCHSDEQIQEYVSEIIELEEKVSPDYLQAEIVHLPESRTGNILMRPAFRNYEIPYLAKSTKEASFQLSIDDLVLQCKNGKTIMLRSKKLNRYIIPHLTNAHNYSNNALPIYQFLANMQFTGKRNGIYFNWGSYQYDFDFLPRVVYKSIIFSPKTWNIKKVSIKPLIETLYKDAFKSEMNTWVHKLQLPEYVVLVDGDNELLITTRNVSSMEMLINTIKRLARFVLKEFLHSENTLVQSKNGNYVNQIILSFYNEKGHKNKAV